MRSRLPTALVLLLAVACEVEPSLEELAFVEDGIDQLLLDLDDNKFATRQRATRRLIEMCRADPSLRERVANAQGSPEVASRVKEILRRSQSIMSWPDAENALLDALESNKDTQEVLEEARLLLGVLAAVAPYHEVVRDQIADAARGGGREFHRRPGGGGALPGVLDFQEERLQALYAKQGLALKTALRTSGVTAANVAGFSNVFAYERGDRRFFLRVDAGGAVELFRNVHDTQRAETVEWHLANILPAGTTLPPRPLLQEVAPLIGSLHVTWRLGDKRAVATVRPKNFKRDAEAPTVAAAYFAALYPDRASVVYSQSQRRVLTVDTQAPATRVDTAR